MSTVDAFDADVLIYAADPQHPTGARIRALLSVEADDGLSDGIGSTLLLPETLAKPLRQSAVAEVANLQAILGRLVLLPVDRRTAELATGLAMEHGLRAADAVHLATAVGVGADRFITGNRRDFPRTITEIEVTYPEDLPEP